MEAGRAAKAYGDAAPLSKHQRRPCTGQPPTRTDMTTRAAARFFLPLGSVLAFIASLGAVPVVHADDPPKLTPVQTALFIDNQLATITKPETLAYVFRHDQPGGESFADEIRLEIKAVRPDGGKDMHIDFLSGARRVEFPGMADFNGNPLLIYYLEYDVRKMQKDTGGSELFFRDRIVIHPYAKIDRPEMAPYIGKSYRFVLSHAVAGSIYQMGSDLPKSGQAAEIIESVTFAGEKPQN
jgi:hypothetical protein